MNHRYYVGERIYLRPLEREDISLLLTWLNDPENWRTLGRSNPINRIREQEYIDQQCSSDADLNFGIVLKSNNRLIGCGGLRGIDAVNRRANLGILIGQRKSQGLGFGTQATQLLVKYGFQERNLNRIELTVFAEHAPAIAMYRRCGFVEEGRLRQAYFRSGRYQDVLQMALLQSDWDEAEEDVQHDAALAALTS